MNVEVKTSTDSSFFQVIAVIPRMNVVIPDVLLGTSAKQEWTGNS